MISQTLTVAGATRPIRHNPQGLDLAFSKVLWALTNPLGNVLSSVGGFFKEQVGERFANLFGDAGSFSTNKQVAARAVADAAGNMGQLIAQLSTSLGDEAALAQIRQMQAQGLLTEFDDERNAAYQQLAEQDAMRGVESRFVAGNETAVTLQKPSAGDLKKAIKLIKSARKFEKQLEKLEAAGIDTELLAQLREDYKSGRIPGNTAQLTALYKFLEKGTELIDAGEYEDATAAQRNRVRVTGRDKDRTEEFKAYLFGMEAVNGLAPGKIIENVAPGKSWHRGMRYRSAVTVDTIEEVAAYEKTTSNAWTSTSMHDSGQPGQGDFMAPRGTPVSILETDDGYFTVTRIGVDTKAGLFVRITAPVNGADREIQLGHLEPRLPKELLEMAKLPASEQQPVKLQAGTVFSYIGLTGNHGVGSGGKLSYAPQSHSHVVDGETGTTMPAWLKRMLGVK
jgi:hypothetical protein